MAKNSKTEATEDPNITNTPLDGEDWAAPSDWDKVQTTFPPYWAAEEGARFWAKVNGRDDSDPDFVRFVMQAVKPTRCYRGGKQFKTEVRVQPGELFTVGVYVGLKLDHLIGCEIVVTVKGKLPANTPAGFVWDFNCQPSPESMRMIQERDRQNPLMEQNAGGE